MKKIVFCTNITTVCASIATVVMAGALVYQSVILGRQSEALSRQTEALEDQAKITKKQFELEYIPLVRIGAVSVNGVPYTETSGSQSLVLYFSIPIENRHGIAYDVTIVKKELVLLRGTYGLETDLTPYTAQLIR